MKVFCYYLKEALLKEFSLDVDVFVSKKRHVQISFKIPISECKIFWSTCWIYLKGVGKKKKELSDYKMTYSRLISSMRWKFDYVFFEKKKKWKTLCKKNYAIKWLMWSMKTFTKKYYFAKISQSKKGHIYLIVRKKEED